MASEEERSAGTHCYLSSSPRKLEDLCKIPKNRVLYIWVVLLLWKLLDNPYPKADIWELKMFWSWPKWFAICFLDSHILNQHSALRNLSLDFTKGLIISMTFFSSIFRLFSFRFSALLHIKTRKYPCRCIVNSFLTARHLHWPSKKPKLIKWLGCYVNF